MEYKGYNIEVSPNTSVHEIHHTGKGSLPKALDGKWTTVGMAKRQIDDYLSRKEVKESK